MKPNLLIFVVLVISAAVVTPVMSQVATKPLIALSADSLDFGTVRVNSTRSLTSEIKNLGTAPLNISSIISSNPAFSFSPATGSVAAGGSLELTIQFTPVISLAYCDSLVIGSNNATNPAITLHLFGRGNEVIKIVPQPYCSNAPYNTIICIDLGVTLDPSTLADSTIKVVGSHSGLHKSSSITFNSDTRRLIWSPSVAFRKGEEVSVTLTSKIKVIGTEPSFIPQTWSFKIQSNPSSGIFRKSASIPVPPGPTSVVAADFDGDGYLDLAVVSHDSSALVIERNMGSWNFVQVAMLDAGFGPTTVLAGDYDGDGLTDLVVTNEDSQLLFFKNNGNFKFTKITLNVPGYIDFLTQGDYDGDGDIDFVAASSSSDVIHDIIRNDGNFKFTVFSYSDNYAQSLVSGDFDGDGDIDVAILNNGSKILRNDGNMKFTPVQASSVGPMASWDFDNDGKLDIISGGYDSGLYLLRNLGYLQFELDDIFPSHTAPPLKEVPIQIDGDGYEDLAALTSNGLQLFKNDSGTAFVNSSTIAVPSGAYNLAAADFNNSGSIDVAVVSVSPSNVLTIYENCESFSEIGISSTRLDFNAVDRDSSKSLSLRISNSGDLSLHIDSMYASTTAFKVLPTSGVIKPGDSFDISVTFTPTEIKSYLDSITIVSSDSAHPVIYCALSGRSSQVLVDSVYPGQNALNADPTNIKAHFLQDVLPSSLTSSTIKVYGSSSGFHSISLVYNSSTRVLAITPTRRFTAGEVITVMVTSGISLTGGIPVLSPFSWSFTMPVRGGSANFAAMKDITVDTYPRFLCSADFNNDGISDIAVSNFSSNSISVIQCFKGTPAHLVKNIAVGQAPMDIAAGDVDGDGNMDIVAILGSAIAMLKGDGNWGFTLTTIPNSPDAEGIALADLDGDGKLDIIVGNNSSDSITVLRNNGNLKFTRLVLPFDVPNPLVIKTGDFDNDGDMDIIVAKGTMDNFALLRNDGMMHFTSVTIPNVSAYVQAMDVADFNGDGKLDIAAENANSRSANVLANEGGLIFQRIIQAGINDDPLSLTAADFNNDGRMDFATVNNSYSNTGSVYINDSLNFKLKSTFTIVPGSQNMISGDFNGDGAMDIAFVNQGSASISWLLNMSSRSYILSTKNVDFGGVKVGKSVKDTVTIMNIDTSKMTVDSIHLKSHSFSSSVNKLSLFSQGTAFIPITFAPDSVGNFADTLVVFLDSVVSDTLLLQGKGLTTVGVHSLNDDIPKEFALGQNYPNPFNSSTSISFDLPSKALVSLRVFDVLGREASLIVSGELGAGSYIRQWNAANLASGVYFYRLEAGSYSDTKRLLLLK